MSDPRPVDEIARSLLAEHDRGEAYRPLPEADRAGGLEHAYQIQDALTALHVARGRTVAGYKIALTSRAMQEMCGVDQPCAGPIFADVIRSSPASLALGAFQHVGVEFEVAVRLGEDLPPIDGGHTRESVAGAVGAIMVSYELVEDRNADYSRMDALSLVADNCWNGGVILGDPVTDWRSLDLTSAATRLTTNGEAAGEGRTGDALGHPFEVVAWLANLIGERGGMLRRDMLLLTGSSITTRFPEPGDRMRFEIEGLGSVALGWES